MIGQFYWYNINAKIKKKCGFEINPYEAIDINTISDFELARKLFSIKNKNKYLNYRFSNFFIN